MGFWDKVVNGGGDGEVGPVPRRQPSTPARGAQAWYPTPQYQPQDQEPWARPSVDEVQYDNMELSEDLLDIMDDTGTTTMSGMRNSRFAPATLDDGMAFLDSVDPNSLSQSMRNEWEWRRIYRAPLHGRSRAMKAERERCPACGDVRYFTRAMNKKNGMLPAPVCMACSYTGDGYSISTLN